MIVSEFQDNLSAMLHGGTLNKVRNLESLMERSANTLLSHIDPINTMRSQALSNTVHDDIYNYSLPSDYKKLIDLIPQARRQSLDSANRIQAERFDLKKALTNKKVSIEGSLGSKIMRINWRTRAPKVLNELDGLTTNGSWAVVATATNIEADTIDYVSGGGSIRFDVAATGDGIQNSTMAKVNLTDEDEVADMWVRFKVKDAADLAKVTSVTTIWGTNVSNNFWTGVAQTVQADGTAFKVGWNEIRVPWSTATEDGTADPANIVFVKVTFTVTGAITDLRVDKISSSIGKNFDIKYYSKFLLKNAAGTWITKTTTGGDTIVLDSDATQLYLLETLIAAAHQVEGTDSSFDITWAKKELWGTDMSGRQGMYARYKGEYPSMSKKAVSYYGSSTSTRHFRRLR